MNRNGTFDMFNPPPGMNRMNPPCASGLEGLIDATSNFSGCWANPGHASKSAKLVRRSMMPI